MHVSVVEISHPDKRHPSGNGKHNHILIGYTHTLCGHEDFKGFGKEMELDKVINLCENCRRLVK